MESAGSLKRTSGVPQLDRSIIPHGLVNSSKSVRHNTTTNNPVDITTYKNEYTHEIELDRVLNPLQQQGFAVSRTCHACVVEKLGRSVAEL